MKKFLFTTMILMFCMISFGQVPVATFEAKAENFYQVDETTISWEVWIRKASGADFGLYGFQFQWQFNQAVLNGGEFRTNEFTQTVGSDVEGFITFFDDANATVIQDGSAFQYVSAPAPTVGSTLTEITNDWKHIITLTAQLTKNGEPHNFASSNPEFAFRQGGVVEVFASSIPHGTGNNGKIEGSLYTAPGVSISDRQLAGHWFSGDGDWDDPSLWNNVTVENTNTLPGANANVIINGNVTIPAGTIISLLPDGDGNGGELTVLTGEETLYTLTLTSTDDLFNVGARENHGGGADPGDWILTVGASGRTAQLAAGQEMRLYTNDPEGWRTFIKWEDTDGDIGTGQNFQDYTMPAKDITVTAVWNPAGKSDKGVDLQYTPEFIINSSSCANQLNRNIKSDLFSSLTIAPTASLTLNNAFNDHELQAEAIIIRSDETGTGTLITNNEGVNATMERYFPAVLQWHLISAPMTDMAIEGSDFEPRSGDPADDFYMWHESGWWLNYKTGVDGNFFNYNPGFDFIPGRGYLVAYNPAEKGQVKRFQGELNTGVVNIDLVINQDEPTPKGDKEWIHQPGWNLIGNPYSAGIDWGLVLDNNPGVLEDNFAYVYDRQTNENGSSEGYTPVNGSEPGAIIAANQGFMVKVAGSGSKNTFSFPPGSRVHGGEFAKDESSDPDHITLRIHNDHYFDETAINLRPESHFDRDRYDALKLFSYNSAIPQLYTWSEDDVRLSVNAIPFIDKDHRIPMGVKFPVDDEYTLRLVDATGEFSSGDIYLYDMLTGEEVLLSENDSYTFVAESSQNNYGSTRFELSFSPDDATSTGDAGETDKIRAWFHESKLHVSTPANNTRIEVIDINGRTQEVFRQDKGKQSYQLRLHSGVYIVRITSPESTSVLRIVQR